MPKAKTIDIILLDDHPIVLGGVEALLTLKPDLRVVASCVDGAAAIDAVESLHPHILILDLHMPGMDGFEVLAKLAALKTTTKALLYVAAPAEHDIARAMKLGTRGVVSKDLPPQFLLRAIRAVHEGQIWVEKGIAERTLHTLLTPDRADRLTTLSDREMQVVSLVAEGLQNGEIATRLGVSEATVKVHLHHVYGKLGVEGRHALIPWLYRRKLLPHTS